MNTHELGGMPQSPEDSTPTTKSLAEKGEDVRAKVIAAYNLGDSKAIFKKLGIGPSVAISVDSIIDALAKHPGLVEEYVQGVEQGSFTDRDGSHTGSSKEESLAADIELVLGLLEQVNDGNSTFSRIKKIFDIVLKSGRSEEGQAFFDDALVATGKLTGEDIKFIKEKLQQIKGLSDFSDESRGIKDELHNRFNGLFKSAYDVYSLPWNKEH